MKRLALAIGPAVILGSAAAPAVVLAAAPAAVVVQHAAPHTLADGPTTNMFHHG